MSEKAAIMLDPALASAVEAMAAPSKEELQRKLDELSKLEADVSRFDAAKQRAEASAARARKRYKAACAARDSAARDVAVMACLAGVQIRARGGDGNDVEEGHAAGTGEPAPATSQAAASWQQDGRSAAA